VEARNERATNLYRRHGFAPAIEWPHWVLPIA
jgi:ribosomal protein S18 acetylase RimI-like enzyme